MTALEEIVLHDRERARAARAWRRSGRRVLGYIGQRFPVELAIAADLLPVRVWGDPELAIRLADRYTPELDLATRSILQRLLDGSVDFIDFLVIDHSRAANASLFASLREIQRTQPIESLPPFAFLDLMRLRRVSSQRYREQRHAELRARIESWIGHAIRDDRLREATALVARQRELLASVNRSRERRPLISGSDALRVARAATVMAPAAHSALVERLLAAPPVGPLDERPRLFVVGSTQEDAGYYQIIESCGCIIVGEDDQEVGGDVSEPAGEPETTLSIVDYAKRVALRAVQTRADAVVALITTGDAVAPWRVPLTRRLLDERSIPLVVIEQLTYASGPSAGHISGEIDALLARIRT